MDGSKSSIISIHALLAESDRSRQIIIIIVDNFYPRSPCGERLDDLQVPASVSKISIHALLAESDAYIQKFDDLFNISIHALLAESDGHPSHIPWR